MEILVRSLKLVFRVLLFIGIYAVTLRVVHTYPVPMPDDQQAILIAISRRFGINDPDNLYLGAFGFGDLIIAVIVYMLVMKVWKNSRRK